MELTPQDRLDIIELQSFYAYGIDHKESHLISKAFTDDIELEYPLFGKLKGLEFLTRWLEVFHSPFDSTQHFIGNHLLEVDGDEVRYRSYVIANMHLDGAPGGDHMSGGGWYDDRVVRTDAGWRIRDRNVTNWWRTGNVGLLEIGREATKPLWEEFGVSV